MELKIVGAQVPCETTPAGIGAGPACPTGSSAGTLTEAFSSGDCEPHWVKPDGYGDVAAGITRLKPKLYAILLPKNSSASSFSTVSAVFESALDGRPLIVAMNATGAITQGHFPCAPDETAKKYVDQASDERTIYRRAD